MIIMKSQNEKVCGIIYFLVITLSVADGRECLGGVNCISLYECKGLFSQLKHNNKPQLTQLLRSLHCGFQDLYVPKICCPPELLNQNDEPKINQPEVELTYKNHTSLLPNERTCGFQNADRLVGGTVTDLDEYPWIALLRYDKPVGYGFYCGGVLISSRYVLTAAHCVKGSGLPPTYRLSQVRLGEWNTSSQVDCVNDDCASPVQDILVEQIIAHEDYVPGDINQHNDIAMLRLARDAQFNDFVKPICLPLSTDLQHSTYEGHVMAVSGWGKTNTRSASDVKLKVRVPVVQNNECGKVYKNVSRAIVNTQMCAGGNAGEDSCKGDSGGALMHPVTPDKWTVFGLVSFGPKICGTPGWPAVYTRIGAYVNWILSQLRS